MGISCIYYYCAQSLVSPSIPFI